MGCASSRGADAEVAAGRPTTAPTANPLQPEHAGTTPTSSVSKPSLPLFAPVEPSSPRGTASSPDKKSPASHVLTPDRGEHGAEHDGQGPALPPVVSRDGEPQTLQAELREAARRQDASLSFLPGPGSSLRLPQHQSSTEVSDAVAVVDPRRTAPALFSASGSGNPLQPPSGSLAESQENSLPKPDHRNTLAQMGYIAAVRQTSFTAVRPEPGSGPDTPATLAGSRPSATAAAVAALSSSGRLLSFLPDRGEPRHSGPSSFADQLPAAATSGRHIALAPSGFSSSRDHSREIFGGGVGAEFAARSGRVPLAPIGPRGSSPRSLSLSRQSTGGVGTLSLRQAELDAYFGPLPTSGVHSSPLPRSAPEPRRLEPQEQARTPPVETAPVDRPLLAAHPHATSSTPDTAVAGHTAAQVAPQQQGHSTTTTELGRAREAEPAAAPEPAPELLEEQRYSAPSIEFILSCASDDVQQSWRAMRVRRDDPVLSENAQLRVRQWADFVGHHKPRYTAPKLHSPVALTQGALALHRPV